MFVAGDAYPVRLPVRGELPVKTQERCWYDGYS
jgi:hypothetical protein